MNLVFPFSKPRFFNFSISSMLLLSIIFKLCFCMDKKTCSELLLTIVVVVGLSTGMDTPKCRGCSRTSSAFCLLMAPGLLIQDSAHFFPSCFNEEVGGICVCSATKYKKRKLEGADLISVSPNRFVPQLSLIPLCCVPLLCSSGILCLNPRGRERVIKLKFNLN